MKTKITLQPLWKPIDFPGRMLGGLLSASYTQTMVGVRVTPSIAFKSSLIAQVVSLKECWKKCIRQKLHPTHPIMTCHWFLGSLWLFLTRHQLLASTQFSWVGISLAHSLNHSRLIIPNKMYYFHRRLNTAAIIPYFSWVRWSHRMIWQRCHLPLLRFEKHPSEQQSFSRWLVDIS